MTATHRDREEAALRELGVTRAGGPARWMLILGFLLTILAVPILETGRECRQAQAGGSPALVTFLGAFPRAATSARATISGGLGPAVTSADHSLKEDFQGLEKSLEKDSVLAHRLLPDFQWLASRYLRLGNEKVFFGRDGWLYYRPDVDYLTAGAFAAGSRDRAGGGAVRQGDPVPALRALRDDLAGRGIRMLVVPVPVKPMIEPEHLAIGPVSERSLQNPSYASFAERLRAEGIEVLDLTSLLLERKRSTGKAQYLQRDTHWTPEAMEAVAGLLAERLRGLFPDDFPRPCPPVPDLVPVHEAGDLAGMLGLPKSPPLFPEQEVVIRPFRGPEGSHWKPDPSSPVLLLGDSFARIFSAEDLRWGRDAGLAERLSEKLGRDVDLLAVNAGGSCLVRQSLARCAERLEGKKVLLYEFSMRDLSEGDWKVIPLPGAGSPAPRAGHGEGGLTVSGVIAELSAIPPPGSTPYRDFVRSLHLTEVRGGTAREVLVFLRAIRNGRPTGTASLQPGQRITLHLVPWDQVEAQFGSLNRSELQGGAADLPDVYWSGDY
jgi:hypothetical protein